jgi:hypothetical protein
MIYITLRAKTHVPLVFQLAAMADASFHLLDIENFFDELDNCFLVRFIHFDELDN